MDAARIRRNPRAVHRPLGEGGVLLHLESGQYHGVNAVGLVVWELLERPLTLDELVAGVCERFDGTPAGVAADVAAFVESLSRRGLVSSEPPARAEP